MRSKLRIRIICLGIMLLVIGLKSNGVSAQPQKSIPQHIKQLVFEQSQFSQPITFELPCADDSSTKQWILEKWEKPSYPFLPPIGSWSTESVDESFLHFLVENKFAKVEKFVMGRGTVYMSEYKILSYSDTIKPYLLKGDFQYDKCKNYDKFHILLAVRTLKSIDYKNEYEATPMGIKIKFFALTFTYTFIEKFPGLPKITKQFRGKAKAYLDPDDGKWKLDELLLADQDNAEYITLLRAQYDIFVKKQQEKFVVSQLNYRYSDQSILFSFQFEGGQPPYKYGELTLNEKSFKEVLGSYIEVEKGFTSISRQPLYWIDFLQLEKGGGGFKFFIRQNWSFEWPPDISFPMRVKTTIFDGAFPPKSASVETVIDSGPSLSVTEKTVTAPWGSSTLWIEKDGNKFKTEDTPKAVSSLKTETTSSKPSFETPEKISIGSLTKDIPDDDYFMARTKVINNPFDIVWAAANKYFSKDKYEITTSDLSKGILVVKAASWLLKTNRNVFVVLIENDSEIKTHITVKAFCYTENASGWSKSSPDLCSEVALKGIEKEVENQKKQSSLPSKESSSLPKDDVEKLSTFITEQWKQIIQIPQPKRDWKELITLEISDGKYDDYLSLYLLGVNRRNLASDALISANTFLTKKGDLKNAKKYAVLATRYYIESNDLFKASEQVSIGSISNAAQTLEVIYKGSSEATKYGLFLTCSPKCYEVADYIFLMTDFAVDYGLEGIDEAKKNLIAKTFVKVLLNTGGVSKWIENRKIYHIGSSGLYRFMDKNINSPEFQRAITEVLVESGAYAGKKMIETGAKAVIQNSLIFVKASSTNDLKGPELMEEPVSNFKPGSEPEGFRGINWGTDISTISSMQNVKTDLFDPEIGLQAYLKDNDELTLGGVPVKKIEYYFLKGKFMGSYIYLEGFDNWTNFKKVVFDKFGEGFQPPKTKEHYSLFGNKAGLTIKYNESLSEGSLFIYSMKMLKEIETIKKKKEKVKNDW